MANGDLKQILCVSCDNASNNETMANELAHKDLLPAYSPSNRVQCFTHVLNLIAKSLLKQFEVVKKSADDTVDHLKFLNEEDYMLQKLAEGSEEEELTTVDELNDNSEEGVEDDLEGYVDEVVSLTASERVLVEKNIQPVKTVLVKVGPQRCFTHQILKQFYRFGS